MTRLFCYDFETTGLHADRHDPIQVAAVMLDEELRELGHFESLIRPLRPENAEPRAMEVNGKNLAELARAPHPIEVFGALSEFIEEHAAGMDVRACGYNIPFDERFRKAAEDAHGFMLPLTGEPLDVMTEAKQAEPRRAKGFKLTDVAERYGVPVRNAHDALGDVRMTAQVLRVLRGKVPALATVGAATPAREPAAVAVPAGLPLFAPEPIAPPAPRFTPSRFQADIFDWVQRGAGDGFVSAVAGSGKTTTITEAAKLVRPTDRVLFLAFNRHIVDELKSRLPASCKVSTSHSVGFGVMTRALGRVQVQENKYSVLIRGYLVDQGIDDEEGTHAGELRDLIGHVQSSLTDPTDAEAVLELIEHFDLEVSDKPFALRALPVILTAGLRAAKEEQVVSYSDMLWIPHVRQLPAPQFDWVFVDESQDLSPAQLELALKCRRPGGRMLFVGDERQAIYGFAGADAASVETIVRRTGARRFPLSICYRCPSLVLEEARRIVPELEAAPGAPAGVVGKLQHEQLPQFLREGDLVLCRLTAPLVELTFDLIRQRIPARMKGLNVGQGLITHLEKVAKLPNFAWVLFPSFLDQYQVTQEEALRGKRDEEMKVEKLRDQVAALRAVHGLSEARDVAELKEVILGLFTEGRPAITLSTIHRAKGLEEERVFIIRPDMLPHPKATGWQAVQEMNLKYVALTRAKRELFYVEAPKS